jgi:hypothetical protein
MAQLEADLMADDMQSEDNDIGKDRVDHRNRKGRAFEVRQGWRRRHPTRVLNQFAGVTNTTSSASSRWEEALVYDTKKVELPEEFRPHDDTAGMTNQIGLVTAALENYKASKNKLQRLHLVGV